jgi:hypothetical protein
MGDYIAKNGGTAPYICPSASQHSKEYCKEFIQGEAQVGRSLMRELLPVTQ